ncbi:hypothetical protein COCMIDRAFT_97821 [Bipolaris oryzae ATCC 44560]|uniref:Uncharacterized protein n=1 Tax=Bipolaris oryzae ATCC 44560 TaxID=930090 RepID=W6Z4C5_COCMI|nr:uncharacterized protein COCMIDRAFT_97821 [Bipolaris oryzae ATCC 44560]EUC44598.1 hypothetical protein COCMIDRAFT_97821 [Bipolaris oryzae ATCC 44560]
MCFYHAYTHQCGHTQMVFQQLCPKGQMIQQKCNRGHDGVILATVKVETSCEMCSVKVRRFSLHTRQELTNSTAVTQL